MDKSSVSIHKQTNDGGNSRCPFINKGVVFLMRSRIHSTMWWNDLPKISRSFCPTSMACESDESFEDTRRPPNRRPRRQHSSLQWLIRSLTCTMVLSCSLLLAIIWRPATRSSIRHSLHRTMGFRSWDWTCCHPTVSRCLPHRSCASARLHLTITTSPFGTFKSLAIRSHFPHTL